jgi:phage shock protein E
LFEKPHRDKEGMMDTNTLYVLLAVVVAYFIFKRLTGVKKTPVAEVEAKIKAGARVIDVRTPQEFSGGAYRKAKNIPLNTLSNRLDELGAKDKPIVVYCASGSRSSHAARILKKAGFTDISNAGALSSMP